MHGTTRPNTGARAEEHAGSESDAGSEAENEEAGEEVSDQESSGGHSHDGASRKGKNRFAWAEKSAAQWEVETPPVEEEGVASPKPTRRPSSRKWARGSARTKGPCVGVSNFPAGGIDYEDGVMRAMRLRRAGGESEMGEPGLSKESYFDDFLQKTLNIKSGRQRDAKRDLCLRSEGVDLFDASCLAGLNYKLVARLTAPDHVVVDSHQSRYYKPTFCCKCWYFDR